MLRYACAFFILLTVCPSLRAEANTPPSAATEDRVSKAFSPSVLSKADASRYREIFALQEEGDWASADETIRQLSDDILMGYVLHQRYMHPTKYRSKYEELHKWMAAYADHPDAATIYRLALRRRTGNARPPIRPSPRQWRTAKEWDLHPDLEADYREKGRGRVSQIEGRVRYLCR